MFAVKYFWGVFLWGWTICASHSRVMGWQGKGGSWLYKPGRDPAALAKVQYRWEKRVSVEERDGKRGKEREGGGEGGRERERDRERERERNRCEVEDSVCV